MSRMRFLVIKGGATWDMTNITSKVKISGRKGSSSRSLTATLLDDDNYGRPRPEIDVGERTEEHTSELQSLMRISYAVY